MRELNFDSYDAFYNWSMTDREAFNSDALINRTKIALRQPFRAVFEAAPEADGGIRSVSYIPGAKLNIAESCFPSARHGAAQRSMDEPAIVFAYDSAPRTLHTWTFAHLDQLSNQVAHAVINKLGMKVGDAIGICMPMTPESVAIYLGVIKAGCAIVSIADSFSAVEIATRMRLGKATAIFTQDVIYRGDKTLPLYERVVESGAARAVCLYFFLSFLTGIMSFSLIFSL
jgi:acetyl-CoA synthetase